MQFELFSSIFTILKQGILTQRKESRMQKRFFTKAISIFLIIFMAITLFSSCNSKKVDEEKETITVFLWGMSTYNKYAPYIQAQLPDINIQFIVGNNDLDFYKFLNENGELPDIITQRRFALHDAAAIKDYLMDLSNTEQAGAVYDSYLSNFQNSDGSINWLPVCGTADGIVANKDLFKEHGIPLPTDYESFIYACSAFEELGIRGFLSDFIYDYTCMEILQGFSISEITSMEGSVWRTGYEDPQGELIGLDDKVWPAVFENMERFIKDVKLGPADVEDNMDYDPILEMFKSGQVAMIRDAGAGVVGLNKENINACILPYFCQDGQQWILTYPEFQIALSKKLESDAQRKDKALKVLEVMLSEEAQKVLSNNEDIITYNKNIKLELAPCLENLNPIIEQNHLYIRIASNDFFSASKDVVQKMIRGEYNAQQAYEAFDSSLRQPKNNTSDPILSLEKGYSNIFFTNGGSKSFSVMANTLRNAYECDVLIAPGYSFSGSVVKGDYSEKRVTTMVLHGLNAYDCVVTGKQLKEIVRGYVEGIEGGFVPFNRGSLPVTSGITIKVEEKDGAYVLLDVQKNGKTVNDEENFKVTCLNFGSYMNPFINNEEYGFVKKELMVKLDWTTYIKEGGTIAEPEDYITVKTK